MRRPRGAQEWQEAVDAAAFLQALDSARLYGFIETDLRPDLERCEYILREGARRGIRPRPIADIGAALLLAKEWFS